MAAHAKRCSHVQTTTLKPLIYKGFKTTAFEALHAARATHCIDEHLVRTRTACARDLHAYSVRDMHFALQHTQLRELFEAIAARSRGRNASVHGLHRHDVHAFRMRCTRRARQSIRSSMLHAHGSEVQAMPCARGSAAQLQPHVPASGRDCQCFDRGVLQFRCTGLQSTRRGPRTGLNDADSGRSMHRHYTACSTACDACEFP